MLKICFYKIPCANLHKIWCAFLFLFCAHLYSPHLVNDVWLRGKTQRSSPPTELFVSPNTRALDDEDALGAYSTSIKSHFKFFYYEKDSEKNSLRQNPSRFCLLFQQNLSPFGRVPAFFLRRTVFWKARDRLVRLSKKRREYWVPILSDFTAHAHGMGLDTSF